MRNSNLSKFLSVALISYGVNAAPLNEDDKSDSVLVARGSTSCTGPAVDLNNAGKQSQTFGFFENASNGDGTADPGFSSPAIKTVTLQGGGQQCVTLPSSFKGRVVRGTKSDITSLPATWVEVAMSFAGFPTANPPIPPNNNAHGDISYETGYDGAATIEATDNQSSTVGGNANGLMAAAPPASKTTKPEDPSWTVIAAPTPTNTNDSTQMDLAKAAIGYLQPLLEGKAYVVGGTGVPDIASTNQVLKVTFYDPSNAEL